MTLQFHDTHTYEKHRYVIWQANKKYVEEHNEHLADDLGFTLAMNEYADLKSDEFATLVMGIHGDPKRNPHIKTHTPVAAAPLPSSVDWRTKGIVTPVKYQGQYGACWAFSATGALEGQHARSTGSLVSLSEQNLVDCVTRSGEGGWPDWAFEYVIHNDGIDTEASYPYQAEQGTCNFNPANVGATCKSYVDITSGDETALTDAIANVGPISVAIDASQSSFQFYSSGVYYAPDASSTNLDHAVLAVGYGEEDGKEIYIVKNSWGTNWGVDGYIYMSRNRNNNCGIATKASYPKV